jgi:predicted anti-sigma-YlaC factor YlaD
MSDLPAPKGSCREFELLMMRHLDGEISPEDEKRLLTHLAACPSCRKTFDEYATLATAAANVEPPEVSQEEWDMYRANVFNRLERGTAWTVLTVGFAAVAAYVLYLLATDLVAAHGVPIWARIAVAVLAAGVMGLFLSVAREKLALRRTDKYKGVQR